MSYFDDVLKYSVVLSNCPIIDRYMVTWYREDASGIKKASPLYEEPDVPQSESGEIKMSIFYE